MLKILWVCNVPLPEIQKIVGVKNYTEGWLIGISNQLRCRKDIEFHYAFPQKRFKRGFNKYMDGIAFWGIYSDRKNPYKIEKKGIQNWEAFVKRIKPDIIHIFGTEYPHSLECIYSLKNRQKVIVSLQGLTSELAKVYTQGIPFIDIMLGKFSNKQYQCLLSEQIAFYRRGANEKKILHNVNNVIGRTDWDRKYMKRVNPKCNYYHCNETLRDTFYEGEWDINDTRKYSIFISQGNYPIKGLHVLISALPFIKEKYPEVKVYVAGNNEFIREETPYGHLIKKLLKKNHLEKKINFLGYLTDKEVKQRLLQTHILLVPSLLENSPNSIGEAMLLGTPVVASNVGGISNILKDQIEGYLYTSTDAKELARRVCEIFADDNLALRFSKRSRRAAKKLYNKSDNLGQLLEIYNEILQNI